MPKKLLIALLITSPLLFVGVSKLLSQGPPQPQPGNPNVTPAFAPKDASYIVTNEDLRLTNEVAASALTTDLVASGTRSIGSAQLRWNNIFGTLGDFLNVLANQISATLDLVISAGQDIFLSPQNIVRIGGNSLAVASLISDPPNAQNGQIYYNSSVNKFRAFENGSWKALISEPSANLSAKGNNNLNLSSSSSQVITHNVGFRPRLIVLNGKILGQNSADFEEGKCMAVGSVQYVGGQVAGGWFFDGPVIFVRSLGFGFSRLLFNSSKTNADLSCISSFSGNSSEGIVTVSGISDAGFSLFFRNNLISGSPDNISFDINWLAIQ